jgi:hypothetical protein
MSEQGRQFSEGANLAIRCAGQPLAPLAVAVAPHHAHPKCRRGVGVPRIRRLECDLTRWNAEPVDGKAIDTWVRLEHTKATVRAQSP